MRYSRFAPPELFAAVSLVSDDSGHYPGTEPDPALASGTHLRTYTGLGASFPLAPLAAFRTSSSETEAIDIDVKGGGAKLDSRTFELYGDRPADVTLVLPERPDARYVRVDLAADGPLSTVDLLDQKGRVVVSRNRPPWSFSAPVLHALRVTGAASEVRVRLREVSIRSILRIDPRTNGHGLLGLPLSDRRRGLAEFNWYIALHSKRDGLDEVRRGAPIRLNPMDLPGVDPLPGIDDSSEVARIDKVTDEQYLAGITRMVSETIPPWLVPPDLLGVVSPPVGQIQRFHATVHGMLQLATTDPGLARCLGSANCVQEFPDIAGDGTVSRWDTLAVIGLLAYSPGDFARLHLDLGPIPDDGVSDGLIDLIAAAMEDFGNDTIKVRPMLDQRIKFARGQGFAVAPFVALTAPLLPAMPPTLPMPQVVRHYWQESDGVNPSSRYRASFAFPDPPLAAMTALGRDEGDGYRTRHERLLELRSDPDWRAVPGLMGYESEPNARANQLAFPDKVQTKAGLVSDHDIPADLDVVRYVAYASDPFGRFGDATRFQLSPPPRPKPPKPVLRYEVDTSTIPVGQDGASPGTLTVTVVVPASDPFTPNEYQTLGRKIVVPRLTELAPGAYPLAELQLTLDGVEWRASLRNPGEQSHSFPLPPLMPQERGEALLTGRYVDSAGNKSDHEQLRITMYDRRPFAPLRTGIGLFWTSPPGPSPEVEVKLAWRGPTTATYRVYLTDAEGLNMGLPTNEPRCVIAEKACQKVIAGHAGDRRGHRLITEPPLEPDGAGAVLFTARLPRSLTSVQFLRVVPLGPEGSEPNFDTCNIVPVAVPDSRRPVPPQLDGHVDPHTGTATITVSTSGFDLMALAKEEPGLFTPGAGGAEPPRYRLRRAVGAVADPIYARERRRGPLAYEPATNNRPARFVATIEDVENGPLEPFVRYVYWAEVCLPDERRLTPGTAPVDGGVTAPDLQASRPHPRPLSRPSAARVLMNAPGDPPPAPAGVMATRVIEGAEVKLTVTVAAPPRAHVKAIDRYRLAVWVKWEHSAITPLTGQPGSWPVIESGTVTLPIVSPPGFDAAAAPLIAQLAYIDPLGRTGETATVSVA